MSERPLLVRVRRQDGPSAAPRWERFRLPWTPDATIADLLHTLGASLTPQLADGSATTPLSWPSECSWPSCGVCTVAINGRAAPACGTRVGALEATRTSHTLTLAPLDAFPVIRDLVVDRSRMRRDAARAEAFTDEAGSAPPDAAARLFARCTRCGACLDACPETHQGSPFLGPQALGAVHATRLSRGAPLPLPLLGAGGIADCGHAQNCVEVCPERIPLDVAIQSAARAAPRRWLATLLRRR